MLDVRERCWQVQRLVSGDDDIVRRDTQDSQTQAAPAATAAAAVPIAEQRAQEQATPVIVTSTRASSRDRSFSDTRGITDLGQSADDSLRRRVALHNISVKIHRENLDQEYGLATPKRADQAQAAAQPAMRRTRSWGDSLNLAGNVHSTRDSLGARLQLSMQQAGVRKVRGSNALTHDRAAKALNNRAEC